MVSVNSAIQRRLDEDVSKSPHPAKVTNHSCYLEWSPDEANLSTEALLTPSSPTVVEDNLLLLIAKINLHVSEITNTTVRYNALKIVSMPDRSNKLDLKHFQSSKDKRMPLAILHLGNERGLNIIARRFDPLMLDIFDIRLENLSLVTIPSRTNSNMYAKFSEERLLASYAEDFHVILLPYCSDACEPSPHKVIEIPLASTKLAPLRKSVECKDVAALPGNELEKKSTEVDLLVDLPEEPPLPQRVSPPQSDEPCVVPVKSTAAETVVNIVSTEKRHSTDGSQNISDIGQGASDLFPGEPFLYDNAHINIINSRKGGQIRTWLKICDLQVKVRAEENRLTLIQFLQQQANLSTSPLVNTNRKFSIPKALVKDLVSSLTDQGICAQLDGFGLERKDKTEQRKNSLLRHLLEKYCTLSQSKFNSTVNKSKLIKSRGTKAKLRSAKLRCSTRTRTANNPKQPEGEPTTDELKVNTEKDKSSESISEKSDNKVITDVSVSLVAIGDVAKIRDDTRIDPDDEAVKKIHIEATPCPGTKRKRRRKKLELVNPGTPCSKDTPNMSNIEAAMKTLQAKLLEIDERLDRQQSSLNNIIERVSATVDEDTKTTLEAQSSCNKGVFRSLKTQEHVTSEEVGLLRDQLSEIQENNKHPPLCKHVPCAEGGNLRESFDMLSREISHIKCSIEQDRTYFSYEIGLLNEQFTKLSNEKVLRRNQIISAADHRYCKKIVNIVKSVKETPDVIHLEDQALICLEEELEIVLDDLDVASHEIVCVETNDNGRVCFVSEELTPSPSQPDLEVNKLLMQINNEPSHMQTTERENLESTSQVTVYTTDGPVAVGSHPYDSGHQNNIPDRQRAIDEDGFETVRNRSASRSRKTTDRSSDGRRDETRNNTRKHLSSQRKTKILVIHDSFHVGFDSALFSTLYDIHTIGYHSVHHILSKGSLIHEVKRIKPEIVFLHVGLDDVRMKERPIDDIINDFKQLFWKLIDETNAKICLSTLIPIPEFQDLNRYISELNKGLSTLVIEFRGRLNQKDRVYSCGNNNLGQHIKRSVGSDGLVFLLTETGRKRLMARMRDTLLRIHDSQNTPNNVNHE